MHRTTSLHKFTFKRGEALLQAIVSPSKCGEAPVLKTSMNQLFTTSVRQTRVKPLTNGRTLVGTHKSPTFRILM